MEISVGIQAISVIIETAVIILAIRIAALGRKAYGWLIALTFTLYVVFDLFRLSVIPIPEPIGSGLFLIASLSALLAVSLILREVTGATIRVIDREWL
ncbi:MAG: hypothetical protein A4E35_00226 [Methanoregula sp. PtaU1.Bin051]|nr:MAG: hypothetical protein A4E35_00226 [Methanoregula sp. PtaU1.Bin051]